MVDASGQIVTPGLVDLHAHVFHKLTYWGLDPDPIASRTGVTTWNDAGSAGALTVEGFREFIVRPARVRITGFVNISSIGLVCDDYEVANPWYCDVGLLQRIVERNRDVVTGREGADGQPAAARRASRSIRCAARARRPTPASCR